MGHNYVECMSSQLDLFTTIPIQSNILKTEEISYKPITSILNNSIIEFSSLGHGDTYRDLSSIQLRLLVRLKKSSTEHFARGQAAILGPDGKTVTTPAKEAEGGGLVNNVLHSLFKQCTIYLNGIAISQSDNNYAYRAYLETILNYNELSSNTHLVTSGFAIDTPGNMNSLTDNKGYLARKKMFEGSCVVELVGKLHGDMLNQNKLLINNVDLRIVLSLEKPEFYTLEADTGTSIMEIIEATMFMNHVTLNPGILIAHEQALAKRNAIYNYKRVEVKSYTVSSLNSSFSLDNCVIGQIPNFILFCMVQNDAYTGQRTLNPYNLQHFDISNFYLTLNGNQIPNQPLMFDYSKQPPISTRGYSNLFKNIGIHYHNHGNLIKKEFFDNGAFMICFDLTNDQSFSEQCANLLNQGTIRIDALDAQLTRFTNAIPNTLTCLVYTEYDACIEIDQARQIIKTL